MTIKAVFFDIDGTLVDSNEFHVFAWARGGHNHRVLTPWQSGRNVTLCASPVGCLYLTIGWDAKQ